MSQSIQIKMIRDYIEIISGLSRLSGHTVIYRLHIDDTQRGFPLLVLFCVMIPAELFGFEDHVSLLDLLIRLVTLFGQHPLLHCGPRVLNQHRSNLLDNEALLRLQGDLVL